MTHLPAPAWRRALVAVVIALYCLLALVAWASDSGSISALCVALLVTVVLAQPMYARKLWAWVAWLVSGFGMLALTVNGHGRIILDLVPILISLALGILFGLTLRHQNTPLIARAICAIEGREHLALPRVAGYARALTIAWTCLFFFQATVFAAMLIWWLPSVAANECLHAWGMNTLHIGGYLLPALFMGIEYGFRRWYLRHLPHSPPHVFLRKLVQNWHGLLRDSTQASGEKY